MCSVIADSKCRPDALPSPLQGMMQWTGERLQDWLGNALPATRSSVVVQEMEGWKAILLFVVLLLLMVCMLLPYILGAITFARIVMAEFHQIQEEREQQQREFDRKRNLMLSDIAHDLRTPVTTVSGYAKHWRIIWYRNRKTAGISERHPE